MPAPPRRRWLRFSLRTVLSLVSLCATLCAAFILVLPARDQHNRVADLVQIGAYVEYDDGSVATDEPLTWESLLYNLRHNVAEVIFNGIKLDTPDGMAMAASDPSPDQIRSLAHFKKLRRVTLTGCRITDGDLEALSEIPLEEFILAQTPISDTGMRSLARIKTLRHLWLERDHLGLNRAYIAPDLSKLNLPWPDGPRITDRGLKELTAHPGLELLNLDGSSITDASLPCLESLPKLRTVYLSNTYIFAPARAKLKRARPELVIYPDEPEPKFEPFESFPFEKKQQSARLDNNPTPPELR